MITSQIELLSQDEDAVENLIDTLVKKVEKAIKDELNSSSVVYNKALFSKKFRRKLKELYYEYRKEHCHMEHYIVAMELCMDDETIGIKLKHKNNECEAARNYEASYEKKLGISYEYQVCDLAGGYHSYFSDVEDAVDTSCTITIKENKLFYENNVDSSFEFVTFTWMKQIPIRETFIMVGEINYSSKA